MKVAFCIRPDYIEKMGGDVIQMTKTKKYLEENFDISVKIISKPKDITREFDIVHIFNFSTYKISRKYFESAIEKNIPVVSSPIYWDYSFASTAKLFYLFPGLSQLKESYIKFFRKVILLIGRFYKKPDVVSYAFKKNAKWMFDNSTFVAPNSIEEAKLLMKWIGINDSRKIRVVFNATEKPEKKSDVDKKVFLEKYGIPDNYILQVGRIEYCKNQLNLVAALINNPEIPIVFVGKIDDKKYFNKILNLAKKRANVFFINAVEHNEINNFYKFANLHVLLSLRESPGLVSIEALSNKCPIVISDDRFLPLNTYFPNQPYKVNPLDIEKIKEVVLDAYKNRIVMPFDFEMFSWSNVSKQTYCIYKEILNK